MNTFLSLSLLQDCDMKTVLKKAQNFIQTQWTVLRKEKRERNKGSFGAWGGIKSLKIREDRVEKRFPNGNIIKKK